MVCQFKLVLLLITICVYANSSFAFSPAILSGSRPKLVTRIQMSDEDTSNVGAEINQTPSQPVVKCPNCDKCDGSGR